jgi:CRP-like cAMP-binding protein
VLALRQFSPLSGVELGELAMLAENVTETTLLAGNRIVTAGSRVPALHLIVDGRIECGGDAWGPRDVFGLLEVLAREPAESTAFAAADTRVFRITAGDTREILEDNFALLRAMLAELSGRMLANGHELSFGAPAAPFGERMTLVERLIALRQHSPLAGARLQALTAVAQLVEQRRWQAGERIVEEGAPADTLVIILDGALRSGTRMLQAGGTIGALEAFAGSPHAIQIDAATSTSALVCPVGALHDVLEDHADLGLAMIHTLARRLLAAARTRN